MALINNMIMSHKSCINATPTLQQAAPGKRREKTMTGKRKEATTTGRIFFHQLAGAMGGGATATLGRSLSSLSFVLISACGTTCRDTEITHQQDGHKNIKLKWGQGEIISIHPIT